MTGAWARFWYDSPFRRDRLAALRFVFFGMLAVDLWALMITRAYRVGALGFNVSHVPSLDAWLPLPWPAIYVVGYLVAGFLAATVALGLRGRASVVALTVIYAALYFWSQQDGYQHHYLLSLLLGIACFVPWHETPPGKPVRSWAVRLIYVQIAIVYFFGGVTKIDPNWLNGWALDVQVGKPAARALMAGIAETLGTPEAAPLAAVAWAVMLWEFFVASAFLVPRLRPLACITGPLFHATVELLGYEIRFFSYYMIALYYVLLFPDAWFAAIARPVSAGLAAVRRRLGRWRPTTRRAIPATIAVVACVAAGASEPYPATAWVGAVFGGVVVARELTTRRLSSADAWRRALVHIVAVATLVVITRPGGAAYDYWRLDGGDRQRRGDVQGAIVAYEHAVALADERPSRERQLADLYVMDRRWTDAEAMYLRALDADPEDEQARDGLARVRGRLERQRREEAR